MPWEYKLVRISDIDAVVDVLDGYGHLGWEAVAVNEVTEGVRVYMKRGTGRDF